MSPMPTALMDNPPRPLIRWGSIVQREIKSEGKGEIWQLAPLSRMKGDFEEDKRDKVTERAVEERGASLIRAKQVWVRVNGRVVNLSNEGSGRCRPRQILNLNILYAIHSNRGVWSRGRC